MPEYHAKHPPEMEPAHPGEILREDVLPTLGLTVTEAARQLRVSRQMLHSILAGNSAADRKAPRRAVALVLEGKARRSAADAQHEPGDRSIPYQGVLGGPSGSIRQWAWTSPEIKHVAFAARFLGLPGLPPVRWTQESLPR